MATIATFIGIDKHASNDVRDLSGARRDAVALNCLFSDSITDIKSTILCDQDATADAIRQTILTTIKQSSEKDKIIFSFSGHGTQDHRLVAHDTRLDNLHNTTVSMAEIAEAFKESKAEIIICIIDCCFSGGAPARVLESTPISRDPGNPYLAIEGNGRVLLAASNVNEVAYEHPTARHGLLTKAIIEVLSNSEKELSIGDMLDKVLDLVRADAGKIGVTQTPHLVSKVEGGMKLPLFRKGDLYKKEFPEFDRAKVSSLMSDLITFGIPGAVIEKWSERYSNGLNELQQQAINDGGILSGDSLLVVAPTSSGKTFVGELATVKAVSDHRRAVFLFPYKALVNEKFDQFKSLYGQNFDYRVIRCTGDYSDQTSAFIKGKYEIAILTYEMFLSVALGNPALLNNVGLVVLDEAHFITDQTRGITVELLLTHLLAIRDQGIKPQLIALSAVIGNINNFDSWLDCKLISSTKRPVDLIEGVIDRTGVFQYIDIDGQEKTEQFIPRHSINQRKEKPSAQDVIVPLVKKLVSGGEKVIVFRNRRGPAEGCAGYLADELNLQGAPDAVSALSYHDNSSVSQKLRECLAKGTAFHTSNLTPDEREVVEREFRNPESSIKVLGATTTVAAGINTPADTVIIAEQEFRGDDGRMFTIAEYKNMAGRAGRLGISKLGRSIIYAESSLQRGQLFTRYVRGVPEPLKSSFDPQHLETWVIRLLAQVKSVPSSEIVHLLSKSYGGYLENRRNPKWQHDIKIRLDEILKQMLELNLAEEEFGHIRLTLLGKACGESTLSFLSTMRLVKIVKEISPNLLTPKLLMALIQILPELDKVYTPYFSRGRGAESGWRNKVDNIFSLGVSSFLQRQANDEEDYNKRCKRVCLLSDWLEGVSIEEIEKDYTKNSFAAPVRYGDIRNTIDSTRFHLRSACKIVSLLVSIPNFEEEVDKFLIQLEKGIPAEIFDLVNLSPVLNRGEFLALKFAGIRNQDEFLKRTADQIGEILGSQTVKKFESVGVKFANA